ncbi:PREDICTED: putative lysozyme-like protein [Populus euphratica]|uniref:AT-hook motif nuclear-localized protein n=1 Tax=Populus euphratica TaxID=75702 RepID=A0AAJ6V555_POPEU|nr:PREDICTED: putative lysozyme-like protein [Populus euphratica]XP_011041162.1 PREDICTED: putative lysozyme-like protein [Populus euphratica]XP_011041163.1 PREDICTED: putative lysozyme-like protein [Populus euphratica]XP_011041164.1 PREDICTED: putative lysozyme-like protein [Populus euphratica]XP_011041165.1 PREDICTED: putative lysozyme-like protein [Populus euphratica]
MPGSETGVMPSREPFGVTGLQQKTAVQSQPFIRNMRLDFGADGTAVYKPIATVTTTSAASPTYPPGGGEGPAGGAVVSPHGINVNMGGGSGGDSMKRKRGRPRKYGPDGTMALALASAPQSVAATQPTGTATGGGFSSPPPPPPPGSDIGFVGAAGVASPPVNQGGSVSPTGVKKARGRPPGSSKKQRLDALGSAGFGFTPHVITVKAGEDISTKVMSFSQHGPRAVCILSANGAISNVTLRQQATSGGTVTYEGRFEILALSGSYLPSENGGQRSRFGGLSVCLSGPDGRVLGGSVAGLLVAAAPVQVVVGSFVADGRKESRTAIHTEPSSATSRLPPKGGSTGVSSPPSRGTLSESSGGPGSPLNQSTGACNNSNPQGMSNMPWE